MDMLIKNLTKEIKSLPVRNVLRGYSFSIEVLPTQSREVPDECVIDYSKIANFDKIFSLEGATTVSKEPTVLVTEEVDDTKETDVVETDESVVDEEESEEKEEEIEEDQSVVENAEEGFICEECGAEFASKRGLNTHISHAHPTL